MSKIVYEGRAAPDRDNATVNYETWLIGFDANQNITDYDVFLKAYADKDAAIAYASTLDREALITRSDLPPDVYTIALVVETVGSADSCSVNIENVYEDIITVKKD